MHRCELFACLCLNVHCIMHLSEDVLGMFDTPSFHRIREMTAGFLTNNNALQRARKTWVKFGQDCELFSAPPLCKGVQGECRKPGYAPPPSAGSAPVYRTRAESEGEGEGEGSRVRSAHHDDVHVNVKHYACLLGCDTSNVSLHETKVSAYRALQNESVVHCGVIWQDRPTRDSAVTYTVTNNSSIYAYQYS